MKTAEQIQNELNNAKLELATTRMSLHASHISNLDRQKIELKAEKIESKIEAINWVLGEQHGIKSRNYVHVHSGQKYTLLVVANTQTHKNDYNPTAVYQSQSTNNVYAQPYRDFERAFANIDKCEHGFEICMLCGYGVRPEFDEGKFIRYDAQSK